MGKPKLEVSFNALMGSMTGYFRVHCSRICAGECMTPTHVARVRFQPEMPPQIPIIIINYNYSYCYYNYDYYHYYYH